MGKYGKKIWKWVEGIVYTVLQKVFHILRKEMTEEQFASVIQFIRFGIVGLSNTVISYILYVVSLILFQKLGMFPRSDYLAAQAIQFTLSVLWSFFWNNKVVFTLEKGQQRSLWKSLVKTYVSYSFTGIFLNSILLIVWIKMLSISEFIAPIINLLVSVPLNFIINKFWTFQEKRSSL